MNEAMENVLSILEKEVAVKKRALHHPDLFQRDKKVILLLLREIAALKLAIKLLKG